jgi:hypothetical protein
MFVKRTLLLALVLVLPLGAVAEEPLEVSGIYPSLASFNKAGECGIGAIVPWAGRLWWVTYPPHETGAETISSIPSGRR